ncbi:MAG: hypothetical protein IPJ65_38115 [Archangiaceae bacterium]|nr:hypothetical protein [Archangiaceae bacterium]
MKIFVDKVTDAQPTTLMRALVRLQDAINVALGRIPYQYGETLNLQGYSTEFTNVVVSHHMPRPAFGLHLVYLRNLTADSTIPSSAPFVDWIPDAGGIRIRSISGLTAANLYEMRFIAYA